MAAFLELYFNQVIVFVLVLTRVSGVLLTMPVFGSAYIPMRLRALLAVAMALMIAPIHWQATVPPPQNLLQLAAVMLEEAMLGLSLGLGVMILMGGVHLAGHIAGQMSGMALAETVDPSFDNSIPIFSQVLDFVTLAVFVCIGGHRLVLGALLDTFRWLPPGNAHLPSDPATAVAELATQCFSLGLRAAAPMMVALLLSILVMGLISRTLPQLNILAFGFSMNSIMVLVALFLSVGGAAWLFHEQLEPMLQTVLEMYQRE